jgi:hypothetical protein
MDKSYIVYYIRNKWNQKVYIGVTNNYERRIKEHFDPAYRKRDKKKILYKAMSVFEKESFEYGVIFNHLLKDEAKFAESFLINTLPSFAPYGYNKAKEDYHLKNEEKMKKQNFTVYHKLQNYILENKNKELL